MQSISSSFPSPIPDPQSAAPGSAWFNRKLIVGGGVIALAVVYLIFTALNSTMVYYLTLPELKAKGDAIYGTQVRIAGQVVAGSVQRETGAQTLNFLVGQGDDRMPVTYRGVVPDIFGDDAEVVLEGTYGPSGTFTAKNLMAKCPSKYTSGDAATGSRSAAPQANRNNS